MSRVAVCAYDGRMKELRPKPWIPLALATLVALPVSVAGQSQGPGLVTPPVMTLDVMTFNIRTSEGRDGGNSWPYRKDLVAETIRSSNPDILGLQEVLGEQIEFLEDAFPEYRWLGVDRGLNGGRGLSEATPIFYRHSEMVPIESGTFWLRDDADPPRRRRRASRIVTWARFHHVETGEQIYAYNTHFTLRRGARQIRSAEMINEHIASRVDGAAVVVMGDFNSVAGSSETWAVATSEGLRDVWLEAEDRQGPPLTSNGFRAPPDGAEGWDGRIDWILVGGAVQVRRAATVVHSADGRYPSDHYPVSATLELSAR
jgi:endonuclease/exonuclease/phosphatase family metal-dependent hydrolase